MSACDLHKYLRKFVSRYVDFVLSRYIDIPIYKMEYQCTSRQTAECLFEFAIGSATYTNIAIRDISILEPGSVIKIDMDEHSIVGFIITSNHITVCQSIKDVMACSITQFELTQFIEAIHKAKLGHMYPLTQTSVTMKPSRNLDVMYCMPVHPFIIYLPTLSPQLEYKLDTVRSEYLESGRNKFRRHNVFGDNIVSEYDNAVMVSVIRKTRSQLDRLRNRDHIHTRLD